MKMNSVGKECNELKHQYDACFNQWFVDKFLRGDTEDACAHLFRIYQTCVKEAIKRNNIELWAAADKGESKKASKEKGSNIYDSSSKDGERR